MKPTVVEGPFAKRKFWQTFTVAGGKVDDKGASIGWKISKRIFRAMIDSALGLDPEDMSEAAKQQRQLRGLADLDGITFVAKIAIEPNSDPRYPDLNRLDHPVLPNEKEWRAVMNGENIPARPSKPRAAAGQKTTDAQARRGRSRNPRRRQPRRRYGGVRPNSAPARSQHPCRAAGTASEPPG